MDTCPDPALAAAEQAQQADCGAGTEATLVSGRRRQQTGRKNCSQQVQQQGAANARDADGVAQQQAQQAQQALVWLYSQVL
jgi:hypothetical protein